MREGEKKKRLVFLRVMDNVVDPYVLGLWVDLILSLMPSTTTYRQGDIVLVSFPFTELASSKRRCPLL